MGDSCKCLKCTTNANYLYQVQELKKTCKELQDDLKRYRRKQKVLEEKVLGTTLTSPSLATPSAPTESTPAASVTTPISPLTSSKPIQAELFNNFTIYELEDSIRHQGTDGSKLTKILARKVFSEEQLKSCSITGKRTLMCGNSPRPPLDSRCLEAIQKVVRGACPNFSRDKFIGAIQNVQKVLRQKAKK